MSAALTRTALELWFHHELSTVSQRRLKAEHDDLSVVATVVPRAEALRLRSRFSAALFDAGLGAPDMERLATDNDTATRFARVLDGVLAETPGYQAIDLGSVSRRPGGLNEAVRQISALSRQGCRLVSPFDPRWADTHAMQEAGSQLRYTHGTKIADPRDRDGEITVWATPDGAARGDERRKEPVELLDREDRMGLSAMRPYLTESDMSVARRVLMADGLQNRRPDAIRRTVALLRELRATGEEFELTPERSGQLSARLVQRNLMVRLAEPADAVGRGSDEPFVGRVYGDGLVWRFSTTEKSSSSSKATIHVPSSAETVLPLRFALGRDLGVPIKGGHADAKGNTMIKLGDDLYLRSGTPNTSASRRLPARFDSPDRAWEFLDETILSARWNFEAELDVEGLIAARVIHGDDPDSEFEAASWSRDPAIAELQRPLIAALAAGGDPDAVRLMAANTVDEVIGHTAPIDTGDDSRWFNPDLAARWASGEESPLSTLRKLSAAMRAIPELPPERVRGLLLGDERRIASFCDDLLRYDAASARSARALPEGSVQRAALETVEQTRAEQGLLSVEAEIDTNGVIHWSAQRADGRGGLHSGYVTGRLGQVFELDQHGALSTRFAGGANHLVVPGYRAVVLPQDAEAGEQTIEERTRLLGYREEMLSRIRQQLASDVVGPNDRLLGATTNLNEVYRTQFEVRYPLDHLERAEIDGSRELAEAVLRTQAGRVRYPEWISDTMYQSWALSNGKGAWLADAVGWTELEATGFRNRTILSAESDGVFDPMMTTDSAPGVTRFLVEGATVAADGRILPGDAAARAAVAYLPGMETCAHDAFDRQRMTLMNLLTASRVTRPVMVAQVPLAGWTMEDGMVVSAEFAAAQRILDQDGTLRALQVGDKISDLHGNKGVVSLVVDRWRPVDGTDPLLDEATELFADNQQLDVVMSPFGSLSRFNGGIPREAVGSAVVLRGAAGMPLESGAEMGALRMIVTNKSVTAGTRVYAEADDLDELAPDEDAQLDVAPPPASKAVGPQGRRVSGQLAWALQAQGCDAVMGELYRRNGTAVDDLREYAGLVGLGVDELGQLQARRPDVTLRRIIDIEPVLDSKGALQRRRTRQAFVEDIAVGGGDLLLPFTLDLPGEPGRAPRTLEVGPEQGTWRLPVLSAHLRKPVPGATNKGHEYSGIYERIFMAAAEYKVLMASGDATPPASQARARLQVAMAQRELNALTSKVIGREFEGRHNIFRDSLMAARQQRSATAVWTADPRLDLDEVGVSSAIASRLGVQDGSYLLTWRDPVLRSSGVRYLRVRVDDCIHGVSINPLATRSFDGDFDGDSVGLVALPQPEPGEPTEGGQFRAHREAMSRLSVEANLVDRGVLEEHAALGYGVRPLAIHTGSDVATAGVDLTRFVAQANDIDADLIDSQNARQRQAVLRQGRELVQKMSDAVRESMAGMSRRYGLRYSSLGGHLDSIRRTCIETGAKGSEQALADYSRYVGFDAATQTDHGRAVPEGGVRRAAQGVNVALVVKKAVGIPGRISQRGVTALRDADLEAALELTYPCTQSQMQCKHDPASALQKYGVMQTTARDLWRGYLMDPGNGFRVATNEKGVPIAASRDQWVDQALALYQAKNGLNIPDIDPQLIERVADALVSEDGYMVNAETLSEFVDENDPRQQPASSRARSGALDRLSYQPSFEALLAECNAGSKLFDGRQITFAPTAVRRNLQRAQQLADQDALFEGIEDAPGPNDRKAAASNPGRRQGVTIVGRASWMPPAVERIGRPDVLTLDDPDYRPKGGSRRPHRATAGTVLLADAPSSLSADCDGPDL